MCLPAWGARFWVGRPIVDDSCCDCTISHDVCACNMMIRSPNNVYIFEDFFTLAPRPDVLRCGVMMLFRSRVELRS